MWGLEQSVVHWRFRVERSYHAYIMHWSDRQHHFGVNRGNRKNSRNQLKTHNFIVYQVNRVNRGNRRPTREISLANVNPGLINHGLLIRGYSSNSHNLILEWYPPKQPRPRGLLIQGWQPSGDRHGRGSCGNQGATARALWLFWFVTGDLPPEKRGKKLNRI